jgi:hypothetical protein
MTIELTSTLWVISHSLCIYRALGSLLKCPSSFSILVDISHDYHMTFSLNTFYKKETQTYLMWSTMRGYAIKIAIDHPLDREPGPGRLCERVSATSRNYGTDITSTVTTYGNGGNCIERYQVPMLLMSAQDSWTLLWCLWCLRVEVYQLHQHVTYLLLTDTSIWGIVHLQGL